MKTIPLTQGVEALVDDEDFELASRYKWHAVRRQHAGQTVYYVSHGRGGSKPSAHGKLALHRLILQAPDGMVVDHINGNPLDNRRANLRICTTAQNARNQRTKTRFKGVERHGPNYRASIDVGSKRIRVGRLPTEIAAARAYNDLALRYHGEFAKLNEVPA